MIDSTLFLDTLERMFPNAHCELYHRNAFELMIAVSLSAQTSDEAVNRVTPDLFEHFPSASALAYADIKEIENTIKTIGLYRNKAKNIKEASLMLEEKYHGKMPHTMKALTSFPGVGRKTANVIRSVWFDIPALAVDTHVERISKRLGFAKFADSTEIVEAKLKRKLNRNRWNHAHHLIIFFGRYFCTARNPQCGQCPFLNQCKNRKFEVYKEKQKRKNK
ncbi:MAG: endonuclease III [Breznakia sp.]